MRIRTLAALAAFSGALLASGAAMATPTLTIDGVTIPTGFAPGGSLITTEGSVETVVQQKGDILSGMAKVTDISDSGFNTTYSYGMNNVFLVAVFTGFKVDTVLAPTATTAGFITFTLGSLNYYVSNTNNFTTGLGSTAADIANVVNNGQLWLSLAPAFVDSDQHTLTITIDAGNTSLTSFQHASAKALLDVVGGDAGSAFNTNSFTNVFSPIGNDDVFFQGTAASNAKGDFPISGSNDLSANPIPEPVSISLFGGGLAAMGAFVRRRKAKKA